MRSSQLALSLLLFGFLAALSTPARADVTCVQAELTKLGFNPGPVDGALGRRTASAAALLATNAGLDLEPLDETNSDLWCETITAFAASPAAQSVSHFDVVSRPDGVLSERDTERQWNVHKVARECFAHPTYAKGKPQVVKTIPPKDLSEREWRSPFPSGTGVKACATAEPFQAPEPIVSVILDETYGERQDHVDLAAEWFRHMSTYVRFTGDPAARNKLKDAVVTWATAGGLTEGIHVSWGHRPVDYQMMTAITALLVATAEVSSSLSASDKGVVGSWLNNLIKQSAAGYWMNRQDNKAYMRTRMALIWGLMVGDDEPVQDAIDAVKLAVHDMRPDGSFPFDSQRGGMGVMYNFVSASHVFLMAALLREAKNLDLFGYEVDGRSLHTMIDFATRSVTSPGPTNQLYAIPCPNGGDRWGTIEHPSTGFLRLADYLLVYATLFPDRATSATIVEQFSGGFSRPLMSEVAGGASACHFALPEWPGTD